MRKYSIGIIGGRGIMGEFFLSFFKKNNITAASYSRSLNISLEQFCSQYDIIIVSVPIDVTAEIIKTITGFLRPDQCLTDFTSVKKFPLEIMEKHSNCSYFGMHPMFAPPISGEISGQNIIFCEGKRSDHQQFLADIFIQNKANVFSLSPVEHDQLMAIVQGLSHFIDVSFVRTLQKTGIDPQKIFQSRSPAYALKMSIAGRTLSQDANLYGNIQIQNPENLKVLQKFFESNTEIFKAIEEKKLSVFEDIFNQGKDYLGSFAELSKKESDRVIDFWAKNISHTEFLKTLEDKKLVLESFHQQKNSSIFPKSKLKTSPIGILGPANTFSHLTAKKFFGEEKKNNIVFYPSIPSIFAAYRQNKIQEILVPLENLLHGSVTESMDGIVNSDLTISAVFEKKISPSLFVPLGREKTQITEIFSHPQALAQCSEFLENEFSGVHITQMPSTVAAIEKMFCHPTAAAIAAPETTENYKATALFSDIANTENNATRFAYLSPFGNSEGDRQFCVYSSGCDGRSALAFSFRKDSPGSLESVLHIFSDLGINLTKIESRPKGSYFGDYIFWIEWEGKLSVLERENLMDQLSPLMGFLKYLGDFEIFREE